MKKKTLNILTIILKIVLVILTVIGLHNSFTSGGVSTGAKKLLFFTVQSNILIMIVMLVFLAKQVYQTVKGENFEIGNWVYVLKFVFTIAITITFLVFWSLIAPNLVSNGKADYLVGIRNLTLHTIVPILAIIDFCICDAGKVRLSKYTFLFGLVMPLLYFGFAMICSVSGIIFYIGSDGVPSNVPYFFMDYVKNGWFTIGNGIIGVFYWVIVVIIIVFAISYGMSLLAKIIAARQDKTRN